MAKWLSGNEFVGGNNDDRNGGGTGDGGADRPQEQAGETAAAATTHDEELGAPRCLQQPGRGLIADHPRDHRYRGEPAPPLSETLGQQLFFPFLDVAPLDR